VTAPATAPLEHPQENGSHTDFQTLTGAECRELLGLGGLGRLGVIRGGFPLIIPVDYAVHGDRIIVLTDAGPTLSAARQHRVSFEVDEIDPRNRRGWSVLVQGFAVEVVRGEDGPYDGIAAVSIEPWVCATCDRILLISPISITGRRFSPSPRRRGSDVPT
jgi:hypothetical protein